MSDYLTFAEVADALGCALKEVRMLVVENKILKATRITKNGLVLDSCGLEGLFPYDLDFCCHLDDNGEITSDVYGGDSTGQTALLKTLDVGALRIARADLENFRIDYPAQTATVAPVVVVGASGGVEPDKAGPPPLTTGDIAFCFAGLRCKTEKEWKTLIGKGRGWVERCLVQPGTRGRGGAPKLWNPVCIGAALIRDGHARPNSVRAKFQTQPLLKPWLDEWKTYEADNLSAD